MNRYAKICGQRVGLDELQTEIGKMFGQKVAAVMTADGEREMIGIFGTKNRMQHGNDVCCNAIRSCVAV